MLYIYCCKRSIISSALLQECPPGHKKLKVLGSVSSPEASFIPVWIHLLHTYHVTVDLTNTIATLHTVILQLTTSNDKYICIEVTQVHMRIHTGGGLTEASGREGRTTTINIATE